MADFGTCLMDALLLLPALVALATAGILACFSGVHAIWRLLRGTMPKHGDQADEARD